MSYVINTTSGNILLTLQDGTTDSSTGLTLIGRNYTGYGLLQNDNFVRLLENFADDIPPGQSVGISAITGTIWYDTSTKLLKVYDGTNFNIISGRIVANSAPTAVNVGDQWWDTVNLQLNSWTGSAWQLIGPNYTPAQGKSGPFVETILDTTSQPHTVITTYTGGTPVTIQSKDATFTPQNTIAGFTTINPGVTVSNAGTFVGTATNSATVGGLSPSLFARTDLPESFASDIAVGGNLVISNSNVYVSSNDLKIQNKNLSGNVELIVNSPVGGTTRGLVIDGFGSAYVIGNPTTVNGIATKGYVDNLSFASNIILETALGQINSNVSQIAIDYLANISVVDQSLSQQVAVLAASTAANISALQNTLSADITLINNNFANIAASLVAIDNTLPLFAPIVDPVFAGNVLVPTINITANPQCAVNGSVLNAVSTNLITNYTTLINNAATQAATNLALAIVPFANIASPTFTGTPQAPTPPVSDATTRIATTAFVTTAVANAPKFNYTVSTSAPSGGNDGDFWFQIG